MTDPTIKRFRCDIKYTASDGYRSETGFCAPTPVFPKNTPKDAMLGAIDELARLCELFGFGFEASTAVADAQCRVREWRHQQQVNAAAYHGTEGEQQ